MNTTKLSIGAGVGTLVAASLTILGPAGVDAHLGQPDHATRPAPAGITLPCPAADHVPLCEIVRGSGQSDSTGPGNAPRRRQVDTTMLGESAAEIAGGCSAASRMRVLACPH